MGEILKTAECDYNNGNTLCFAFFLCFLKFPLYFLNKSSHSPNPHVSVSVCKTTVLLADINDFNAVNQVYKTCESRPYTHTLICCVCVMNALVLQPQHGMVHLYLSC